MLKHTSIFLFNDMYGKTMAVLGIGSIIKYLIK